MKAVSHRTIKRQEARQRVAAVRLARRSTRTARAMQRRVSLTVTGAKWRITNLRQVARALAAWA